MAELTGAGYNLIGRHFGLHQIDTPSEMTDRAFDALGIKRPSTPAEQFTEMAAGMVPFGAGSAGTLGKAIEANKIDNIDNVIKQAYRQAIRPTPSRLGDSSKQVANYYGHVRNAFDSIIGNKNNLRYVGPNGEVVGEGRLPQTMAEFSEAAEQTKGAIARQFDSMAQQAGQDGAIVDLRPIATRLREIAADPGAVRGDAASYAQTMADHFDRVGAVTPGVAQKDIIALNEDLKTYLRKGTYSPGKMQSVDKVLASAYREQLDKAISDLQGPGYQDLKNKWGSLNHIESDITHSAERQANLDASGHGLTGRLWDTAAAAEMLVGAGATAMGHGIEGLASGVAGAAGTKAAQMWIRWLRDGNRAIKRAFEQAEKYRPKTPETEPPPPAPPPIINTGPQPPRPTGLGMPEARAGTPAPPGGVMTPGSPIPADQTFGLQPARPFGQGMPEARPGVPPTPGGTTMPSSASMPQIPPQRPQIPDEALRAMGLEY